FVGARMHGDAARTGLERDAGEGPQVGHAGAPRIAQQRDLVEVDAESGHRSGRGAVAGVECDIGWAHDGPHGSIAARDQKDTQGEPCGTTTRVAEAAERRAKSPPARLGRGVALFQGMTAWTPTAIHSHARPGQMRSRILTRSSLAPASQASTSSTSC